MDVLTEQFLSSQVVVVNPEGVIEPYEPPEIRTFMSLNTDHPLPSERSCYNIN